MADETGPVPLQGEPHVSFEKLFSEDPLNWTNEDVEAITARLRSERANFIAQETEAARGAGKVPKPAKIAQEKVAKPAKSAKAASGSLKGLTLDDLGISLLPAPAAKAPAGPTIHNDPAQEKLL